MCKTLTKTGGWDMNPVYEKLMSCYKSVKEKIDLVGSEGKAL